MGHKRARHGKHLPLTATQFPCFFFFFFFKTGKIMEYSSKSGFLIKYPPISRFSMTVRVANMFSVCGTKPIPFPTSSNGSAPLMSSPSRNILPEPGLTSPKMVFRSVLFPHPLGPIITTISPAATLMLTPFTTVVSPYPENTFSTESMLSSKIDIYDRLIAPNLFRSTGCDKLSLVHYVNDIAETHENIDIVLNDKESPFL